MFVVVGCPGIVSCLVVGSPRSFESCAFVTVGSLEVMGVGDTIFVIVGSAGAAGQGCPGPAHAAEPSSWPWAPGPQGSHPIPQGHRLHTRWPWFVLNVRRAGAHLGKGDEEELVVRVFQVVQGMLRAMLPHPLLVGLKNKCCPQYGLGIPQNLPRHLHPPKPPSNQQEPTHSLVQEAR